MDALFFDFGSGEHGEKLNDISWEIWGDCCMVRNELELTVECLQINLDLLNDIKKDFFEYEIGDFLEVINKIKVFEIDEMQFEPEKVSEDLKKISVKFDNRGKDILLGISLQTKIDKAKEIQLKLNAECEELTRKKEKIEKTTIELEEMRGTLYRLSYCSRTATRKVSVIIREFGTDYSSYSDEQKGDVEVMCTLNMTLRKLIFTPVLDNNGRINGEFYDFIQEAEELIDQIEEEWGET